MHKLLCHLTDANVYLRYGVPNGQKLLAVLRLPSNPCGVMVRMQAGGFKFESQGSKSVKLFKITTRLVVFRHGICNLPCFCFFSLKLLHRSHTLSGEPNGSSSRLWPENSIAETYRICKNIYDIN